MKIIDKINACIQRNETFFSFEYFPPRTEEGVENLFERLERMAAYGPTFCDITWGAGGSTADVTLDIAVKMQNYVCVDTMMHLTCTNMPVESLQHALDEAKKNNIRNILALRGDPPKGQEKFEAIEGGLSCALDLVRYIRKEYGNDFGIGVAGYPEVHPDHIVDDPEQMEKNYLASLEYLKQKIEAGADFIVTQLFYDVDIFLKFVKDCRSVGITCPILPGIMPIVTYGGFTRMTGFCKTKVPAAIKDALESIKDNEEAVKEYGEKLCFEMCQQLLASGLVVGLHMYTLNLERCAVATLEKLGLLTADKVNRRLSWRMIPSTSTRAEEAVRPIFWSNRPRAYIKRTGEWDSFPSGRWGNSCSPGYGTLVNYPFMRPHTSNTKKREKAKAVWGETLSSLEDVKGVFVKYCKGEISVLPWSEMETMHGETDTIRSQLLALNEKGLLTVNSQPAVNGAPSSDANVGWGGQGGYVYQKAYVEFFVAPSAVDALLTHLSTTPSISYLASTFSGEVKSNMAAEDVNAVTWGVFPNKEVVQPTVVCARSFKVWREEAFDLWVTEWGSLYEEGSASQALLKEIHDTWYLVSVVDNDYVGGHLFKVLEASA